MRLQRGFDLDPSCKLWLPFYAYDKNVNKIYDMSGNNNHGAITGAQPAVYPIAGGVELVSNGGMESGNPPTGNTVIGTPAIFEQSGVQKHSGSYSCHINDSTPTNNGGFYNRANTTAGKTYKHSFWYWIVSGSINAGVMLGDGSQWIKQTRLTTTGSWQYYEEFVIQTITGTYGSGYQNYSNSVAAEYYIDDVSVQEVIGYEGIGWNFDGTDDKVTLPTINVSDFSILLWARPFLPTVNYDSYLNLRDANPYGISIDKGGVDPTAYGIRIDTLGLLNQNAFFTNSTPIVKAPTQWNLFGLAYLVSSKVLSIYFNGTYGFTPTYTVAGGAMPTSFTAVDVGGAGWGSFGRANIGEALLFNRALSAAEIKNYFEKTRRIYGV
jgi:hypothetical protein